MWQAIFARMSQKQLPFSLPAEFNQAACIYIQGKMYIYMRLVPSKKCIHCRVEIANEHYKDYFEQLELQSAAIEAELKHSLRWDNGPGKIRAYIYMEENINPKDPANREQVIAWFDANAVSFYNAFRGRIERLHVPG